VCCQHFNDFTLDEGGINIKDNKALRTASVLVWLEGNIDPKFGSK